MFNLLCVVAIRYADFIKPCHYDFLEHLSDHHYHLDEKEYFWVVRPLKISDLCRLSNMFGKVFIRYLYILNDITNLNNQSNSRYIKKHY